MKTEFWRITLDTNPEDCNLRCIMCEENSPLSNFREEMYRETGQRRRLMPLEWIAPILQQAALLGIKEIIPTTMGDPLMTSHIEEIALVAPAHGMVLNVTHNGSFPRKTVGDWAKLLIPVTRDIKISWNGATAKTAERIMTGIDFDKAISNLKSFIEYRNEWARMYGHYCRITFQLTFMQSNMSELEDIIRLAASLGVDRIKGHHLWVHFLELQHESFKENASCAKAWNKIVSNIQTWQRQFPKPNGKEMLFEGFFPLDLNEAGAVPESYECPFLGRELWVSASGEVSPCCAPDELRKSLGQFGNIKNHTLFEITKGEGYCQLINNYKEYKLCKTCNMRKPASSLNC